MSRQDRAKILYEETQRLFKSLIQNSSLKKIK